MMPRLLTSLTALLTVAAVASGCAGTYVNVPALDGSPASQNPNSTLVRNVEAEALRHVLNRYPPPDGEYAVALPAGTDDATYWWVLRHLPEGGQELRRIEDDQEIPPVYRVAQVVVRGLVGQVEVVIPPDRHGEERLVSVFLSPDTEGWYANRSRLWTIPAHQALRIIRQQHIDTLQREEGIEIDAEQTLDELEQLDEQLTP